jgi:hypothetical protein
MTTTNESDSTRSGAEEHIEKRLQELGVYRGPVDGQWREDAQKAFCLWKAAHGFANTANVTADVLAALLPGSVRCEGSLWFRPLDADDFEAQLPWCKRLSEAIHAEDGTAERIAAEWILRHGIRAVLVAGMLLENPPEGLEEEMASFCGLLEDVMRRILLGEVFTDWADEDARRAALGRAIIEAELEDEGGHSILQPLLRLAARAVLSLAADHPMRDPEAARVAMLRALEFSAGEGNDEQMERLVLGDLLRFELLEEGEERARAEARLQQLAEPRQPDAVDELRAEMQERDEEEEGISGEQLDLVERVLQTDRLEDEFERQKWLIRCAQDRLSRGQTEEARELFADCLAYFQPLAVLNTSRASRDDVMEQYAFAYAGLALALARLDRPREVFEVLNAHRAVEIRLRAQLRRNEEGGGSTALAVADRVRALRLGLREPDVAEFAPAPADPLGRAIHPFDRGREQLRLSLERAGGWSLSSTGWDELTKVLGEGDVVLALSCTGGGTSGVVLRREETPGGDGGIRAECIDWPDMTAEHMTMYGENHSAMRGWPMGLGVIGRFDFRASVTAFVEEISDDIDERLRALIGPSPRRIYFMPDSVWWMVPAWALRSLRQSELVVCLGVESLVSARPRKRLPRRALVVGDPLGDLPLADLEVASASRALQSIDIEVRKMVGAEATKERVLSAMSRSGIVHFAGHGVAQLADPLDSALPLAMRAREEPDAEVEQLRLRLAVVHSSRWPELADQDLEFKLLDRWPVKLRFDGQGERVAGIVRLSASRSVGIVATTEEEFFRELLTAADLSAAGIDLTDCGLAFLSACTCGAPRFSDGFLTGGLVGALLEAGVQSVVSCMWPIPDAFACFYGDLLYGRVAAHLGAGEVPIASLVAELSAELRSMPLQAALDGLTRVELACTDDDQRTAVRRYRQALEKRGERPFGEAIDWAAFFVSGAPVVRFG